MQASQNANEIALYCSDEHKKHTHYAVITILTNYFNGLADMLQLALRTISRLFSIVSFFEAAGSKAQINTEIGG